jgi:hypothetical protein
MSGGERACYRFRTVALAGPWRRSTDKAMRDAIEAGQIRDAGADSQWRVSGEIETSYCDRGGPCGGVYPPE